jgi:hypothetical protein
LRVVINASDRVAALVRTTLPAHARRRGVVVLVHGRGPAPPWCPSAATIEGVVAGCIDAAIAARWDALGRRPTSVGALARIAPPVADRRTITLRIDGFRAELPRAWVGRHALVVAPAVIDTMRDGRDLGPFEAMLAALATSAQTSGIDGTAIAPHAVGAALLGRVFAGFTWLLDARHALVRSRRTPSRWRADELAIGRAFVHGDIGIDADTILHRAAAFDRWLACRGDAPGVELQGAAADDPWPVRPRVAVGVGGPLWSAPRGRREARRP